MASTAYDVFLSYVSSDREAVTTIAEHLRSAGIRPWFDIWNLPPGQRFQGALAQGIRESAAFAFFVGPSRVDAATRWAGLEIDIAINRAFDEGDVSFPVFAVILPGATNVEMRDLPEYLRIRSNIDLRGGLDDRAAIRRLVNALRHPAAHVPVRPPSPPQTPGPTSGDGPTVDGNSRPVATISHLRTNPHLIHEPIANRTLTPLIGAGCSLVGRSQSHAWAHIAGRLEHLIELLGNDNQAAQYVRGLAASSPYDVALYGPFSVDVDEALQDERLLELQVTLARLGTYLGSLFANSMISTATPVWDAVAYRLPIDPNDPNLLEVCRWSVLACVKAHALRSTREGRDATVGLGAPGMYDRLVELTAHFDHDSNLTREALRSGDPRMAQVYDEVLADISSARSRERADELLAMSVGGYLSLHELEWVADALWHTLRYDLAAYPRADEFAFQVSLFVTGASGRRPEREGAAEAARSRLSSATIATWFRQYSGSPSNRMLAFYNALARVLAAEFDTREKAHRGGRDGAGPITPLDPVAFSTNFDLEMERALQACEETPIFHVVIPVYAYPDPDPNCKPEVRWMIGRTARQTPVESPQWTWFPDPKLPKPASIQGPILIKLNGSPLHELPPPGQIGGLDQDAPDYDRFDHALILSETEHLQHIVWRDALPKFAENALLQKDRTLVFLGYSIKEWSTRLRIFTQIHRRDRPPVNRRESRMLAINRSHDPFRSAILGSIGVHRLVGDLEEFTRLVRDFLE